jgi:hypothetical protein
MAAQANFHVVECAQKKIASMMDVQRCTEYSVGMLVAQGPGALGERTVADIRRECARKIDQTQLKDIHSLCAAKADTYAGSELIKQWRSA